MMGTQPSSRQPALFSYHIDLESRVDADHLLRHLSAALDLSFVLPTVQHLYGRSGHLSLDPRLIIKLLLLLFLYNIPSERELMEQVRVRLDFLWFLNLDLDSAIPHHSVLSKARARWGKDVFEQLFIQTVRQCVQAGLVNGRLLHIDSTMTKANASKDSVVPTGPELVRALRQAYREQEAKLEALPAPPKDNASPTAGPVPVSAPEPKGTPAAVVISAPADPSASDSPKPPEASSAEVPSSSVPAQPVVPPIVAQATLEASALPSVTLEDQPNPVTVAPAAPVLQVLPAPSTPEPKAENSKPAGKKLPVNSTHLSTTDPQAELARSKNGLTELNFKEHRLVDDAQGVITAVAATPANVHDASQLPALYEQHVSHSGLKPAEVTLAGDHHYGTAANYIYCAQEGVRAHLADASAHLEERGKLPLSQFVYEPAEDRLHCPQGHYLIFHQDRPDEQAKVYLIEDPACCAGCALREQCTKAKQGRSIQRHVLAEVVEAARAEANSPAARYNRQRRQHVMEGSFADAVNNHGAKKARWRGLWRQQIQSWMIAGVQNLRVLVRHQVRGPLRAAALALAATAANGGVLNGIARIASFWSRWARFGSSERISHSQDNLLLCISDYGRY